MALEGDHCALNCIQAGCRTPHCATQRRRQCGAQHRTSEAERYIGAARMAERRSALTP